MQASVAAEASQARPKRACGREPCRNSTRFGTWGQGSEHLHAGGSSDPVLRAQRLVRWKHMPLARNDLFILGQLLVH